MSTAARRLLTPQEYLALERAAMTKSEFVDGVIFAMAGGSPGHDTINVNIVALLWNHLKGSKCRVHSSDLRVKSNDSRFYSYPDASVVCGPPEFDDQFADTLVNPKIIVEVLSPSTESDDRGGKFRQYQRIESLVEYILVSQTEPLVERFVRNARGRWELDDASGLESSIHLEAIHCELRLAEIYDGVDFPADSTSGEVSEVPSV